MCASSVQGLNKMQMEIVERVYSIELSRFDVIVRSIALLAQKSIPR